MAYQDAWKQIANIGDPARTIAGETALLAERNALVQEGNKNMVDLVKGIGQSDADRIAAEAKNLFNTGNPLIDNRNRIEFGEGQVGIHSPGQLSKLFGAQLKTDQDTVQSEAQMFDQVKTMRDSQKVTGQMGESDWSDPLSLTQQSLDWTDNANNNVNQSALTNKMVDTIVNQSGYQFNPENIFSSMRELSLDVNDKKSYTGTIETAAINRSADSLQQKYEGLPREVAIAAGTKLLGKTKYAGEFARGKTVEGKRTIATDKVEAISSALVNAANLDSDLKTTYTNKVKAVNNALKHVGKTSNMPKEDRERWDTQIMGVLESMNLMPGSGAQGRFGEARSIFSGLFENIINEKTGEVISSKDQQIAQQLQGPNGATLGIQAKFKDHIRKRLKDPKTGFPMLPDRIIDAHIDKLVAADPYLGPAFTLGKSLAAERVELRSLTTKSNAATRLKDNKKLIQINITGGGPETAINDTLAKLTEKGIIDQTQTSLDGQNKFRLQATRVYTDLRDSFIYDDPKTGESIDLLDDQGLDAFNMAYHKMLTGKTRVQKDTGLFGVQAWFTPDYDIAGAGGEMSKRDPQNLLRIMLKSVPSKASDAMKTNIKSFKKAVFKRKQAVKAGAETDAMKNWGLWDKIVTRIGG